MPENQTTTNQQAISHYIANGQITLSQDSYIAVGGSATYGGNGLTQWTVQVDTKKDGGLHPVLFFKYVKSKFGMLERMRMDRRLKILEKSFYTAIENGQDALGNKILKQMAIEVREAAIYTKGVKHFIEREDLVKHKRNIRGGHISDTLIKEYTRVIPKDVVEKKNKVKDCFDDFVIYHYWDEAAGKKAEKKERMTPEEKGRMRDPVLFGIIKETDRLYFVAEWDDELCDLSFTEMIDAIGKDDEEFKLSDKPTLEVK